MHTHAHFSLPVQQEDLTDILSPHHEIGNGWQFPCHYLDSLPTSLLLPSPRPSSISSLEILLFPHSLLSFASHCSRTIY